MTTTRQTIETYFTALQGGGDWTAVLDPGLRFSSRVTPGKEITGRDAYLASTAPFFGMVRGVEPLEIVIDGDRAATLSTYSLVPPDGDPFVSVVAEFFTVAAGRITELSICFDTAPYPRPAAPR